MRRAFALLAVAVAVGTAGCSSTTRTPTVAKIDFAPKVRLDIRGCPALPSAASTACDEGLVVVPAKQPSGAPVRAVNDGSVLVVTNVAGGTHRVTGTVKDVPVFDTGQMVRGNSTTVVLQTPGTVVITDSTTGQHTSLVVRPASPAKS